MGPSVAEVLGCPHQLLELVLKSHQLDRDRLCLVELLDQLLRGGESPTALTRLGLRLMRPLARVCLRQACNRA